MSYITTFTGIDFFVDNFTDDDFDITDIAHALSMTCRWGGHVPVFFSVAQHAVYVSRLMQKNKMHGLLHDGSEAYITDVATPFKNKLKDYRLLEDRIQNAVYRKFLGVVPNQEDHEYLKIYDRQMLDIEGTLFIKHWQTPVDLAPLYVIDEKFFPWAPFEAEQRFLQEFRKLV